ncbi:MAG: hypothetical protein WBO23_16395 [Burkholderiales bacterium]
MLASIGRSVFLYFPIIMGALLSYGCGSAPGRSAAQPSATVRPLPGKTLVVFVRALSSDATSVDYRRSPVFEIGSGASAPELVGILPVRTMLAYQMNPGKHLFMVVGENADFMTADVVAGTTYYVLVTGRVATRTAFYALRPVTRREQNSNEFRELVASSKWVERTTEWDAWAIANRGFVTSRQSESYRAWLRKADSEKQHLRPDDGVPGSGRASP